MDEETAIINNNTRNEKIKNFLLENKKKILVILLSIIIILIGYFAFKDYKEKKKIEISDKYNLAVTYYTEKNKDKTRNILMSLIKEKDSTYSPLSLNYIIDNKLITEVAKINELFDIVINEVNLEDEIRNLIIYKKALYNADQINEIDLLGILNPIINSNSIWKSHSLYLIGEYFFSKNEKKKAKEFFNQIIILENANEDLKIEAQKRLNRDLSE